MPDVSKPQAKECFVIKALAAGEAVIGKKGFVNCQLLGCCNTNRPTFYVPATILGLNIQGCDEVRVLVKLNITLLAADNLVMDVAPNGFFPTEKSVEAFIEAQRVYGEYKKATKAFENYHTDLRSVKNAFSELIVKVKPEIKEDFDDYVKQNEKSNSRLNIAEYKRFGLLFAKSLFYPELTEEEEPNDLDNE